VQAKQPVLSLQDIKDVEIEVSVPEERVIRGRGDKGRYRFSATFDYLPGREFEVQLTEFATDADPLTQTYLATFVMPAPEDVIILPGMTTTIHEYRKEGEDAEEGGYAVPIDAVPIDGLGTYFVWMVQADQEGTFTVHRRDVQVGQMVEDEILVMAGLENGDRIAAVGVHVLREGQRVRLLESTAEDGAE
jgi:RND family efflux transporter MFP subunit